MKDIHECVFSPLNTEGEKKKNNRKRGRVPIKYVPKRLTRKDKRKHVEN